MSASASAHGANPTSSSSPTAARAALLSDMLASGSQRVVVPAAVRPGPRVCGWPSVRPTRMVAPCGRGRLAVCVRRWVVERAGGANSHLMRMDSQWGDH
jgi:hypothetical protein